jgi:hypothetical protein
MPRLHLEPIAICRRCLSCDQHCIHLVALRVLFEVHQVVKQLQNTQEPTEYVIQIRNRARLICQPGYG